KPSQQVLDILKDHGHSSACLLNPDVPLGVQLPNIPDVSNEGENEATWVMVLEDETFLTEYAMVTKMSKVESLEPRSLAKAKLHPDWPPWEKAVEEELRML
ncbi:hypothetical protein F5050DRAFT_1554860, partial [Lentinula boryana]